MFKILILQVQHNLSDARMQFMVRDRPSWVWFLGSSLGDRTPDENTIRHFRNRLTETGTLKRVIKAFDWQLQKRRATSQWRADRPMRYGRATQPRAAQKDTDARWTLKIGGKVRCRPDGTPLPMIAIPVFRYKSHISIDQRYGFIRAAAVTSASHPDGRMLRQVIDWENTGSEVWADSAYRSQSNGAWLDASMLTSRIHRRKPRGKLMPTATARANAAK